MRKKLGWLVVAIVGAVAFVVLFLRDLLLPDTAKHEAAKLNLDEKKEALDEKKAEVAAAETEAAKTHESVEKRLAEIDARVADERKKDSVDLANDIINGA
jgi:hypothetical protein